MATLFYCQNQFRRIAKADAVIHLLPIEVNTSDCMLVVLLATLKQMIPFADCTVELGFKNIFCHSHFGS